MTITLTLDQETEELIGLKAAALGLSIPDYMAKLARRNAHAKPRRTKASTIKPSPDPAVRLQEIVDRADPAELRANGITLAKYPGKTGADLLRNLEKAGLTGHFGDPSIDSPELARQLREQAQKRDWS